MSAFDDPWYAEMIERFSPEDGDENGRAGRAILAGFCILAQAIDGLAEAMKAANAEMPERR